jgi:hypothetical protein
VRPLLPVTRNLFPVTRNLYPAPCTLFYMPRPLLILTLLLTTIPARPQTPASNSLAGTQSIGDTVNTGDAAAHHTMRTRGLTPTPAAPQPIHILYMHGINQVGAGDSTELRKAICRYIHECTVTPLGRIYAEGPFAVHAPPPNFVYMQQPIWSTPDDWSASAPFIDRYQISGGSHVPIVLEEINWWPIVYPIKCKSLIAHDAALTGPVKLQLNICAAAPNGTQPDPNHPGRYLQYQWIASAEAADLARIPRHATYANRDLKSNLMTGASPTRSSLSAPPSRSSTQAFASCSSSLSSRRRRSLHRQPPGFRPRILLHHPLTRQLSRTRHPRFRLARLKGRRASPVR